MFILVTIHTERKFYFEPGLLAQRGMAGRTGDGRVREDQGEAGLRVIGEGEGGGAPTVHGMTTLATATVGAG